MIKVNIENGYNCSITDIVEYTPNKESVNVNRKMHFFSNLKM